MSNSKHIQTGKFATLGIVVLIPLILLMGFGAFSIFKHGYAIEFSIALLSCSVLAVFSIFILKKITHRNHSPTFADSKTDFVEPSQDWSDQETRIWEDSNQYIQSLLDERSEWIDLKDHGLFVAKHISQSFGKKELDFTVVEGLMLLEEISKRYRHVLKNNIPGVDLAKVSHLKFIYEFNENHGDTAKSIFKWADPIYRIARAAVNPAAALSNEIRNLVLGNVAEELSDRIIAKAKKSLLQEVASVCIDLYSGRFSIEDSYIRESQAVQDDSKRVAADFEPLRIVVVGQLSSGKSSLVNALKNDFVAEVDMLPTTDGVTVYNFNLGDDEELKLIDLPGLDGNSKVLEQMINEITQSDMVLWMLKANQSSRNLDKSLLDGITAHYAKIENITAKKPKLIGILNQVDKLKPASEWTPPYNLLDLSIPKVKIIQDAIAFNQKLMGFDTILPLAIPDDKDFFGLEDIQSVIELSYCDAKNVQRNRQRNEARGNDSGILNQGRRLFNGAKNIISR